VNCVKFDLKVVRGSEVSSLALEAPDPAQAQSQAEAQGYSVLAVRSAGKRARLSPFRRSSFSLLLFSQELLLLLESGLSLVESMEALSEKAHHPESRAVLQGVMAALYEGLPLSVALERFPLVFPPLYVAMIRASERTGDMANTLARHVTYQIQLDAVRKKIVTASIYPVLLIVVGGLVLLFLLGYVVPRFSTIYENSGADLPWMSQLLLQWGRLMQERGGQVFLAFGAITATAIYAVSLPASRRKLADWLWQLPAFGETLRIYQLARFYRTLGMLLSGGIPLVTGMQMVAPLLQPKLRDGLVQVEHEVREGKPLSVSMEMHHLTTPVALRMLRVGERTGRMGDMMERIGVFYDDEIARAVDWFTRLLEPVLMVVIGLVIGAVVTLMYMPIFELAGSMQ
jgi:general secretion pathway protein F